ncbi:uncharacterized protein UTRI_06253 [Ustilago trichophora]|uniref:Uncharacterized protein n=1 Tax=Ustilago trichophora TaxID=86804 RepID=A0A5C3EF56_9BASI|nr:uncharacterized protein UTRI_06253 [Ustilago trichophora]
MRYNLFSGSIWQLSFLLLVLNALFLQTLAAGGEDSSNPQGGPPHSFHAESADTPAIPARPIRALTPGGEGIPAFYFERKRFGQEPVIYAFVLDHHLKNGQTLSRAYPRASVLRVLDEDVPFIRDIDVLGLFNKALASNEKQLIYLGRTQDEPAYTNRVVAFPVSLLELSRYATNNRLPLHYQQVKTFLSQRMWDDSQARIFAILSAHRPDGQNFVGHKGLRLHGYVAADKVPDIEKALSDAPRPIAGTAIHGPGAVITPLEMFQALDLVH